MDKPLCDKPDQVRKVTEALSVISGKWKITILVYLRYGCTLRFSELRRMMPGVTQKMLTAQLRELERDGLILRKVYAEVPPRVEYSLSEYGLTLGPVIVAMHEWGEQHMERAATPK